MYSLELIPVGFSYGFAVTYVTDRPIDNKLIYDFLTTGDNNMKDSHINEKLLNDLDSIEAQLVEEYKAISKLCVDAAKNKSSFATCDALSQRRELIKTLLHTARAYLRETAPELYPDL